MPGRQWKRGHVAVACEAGISSTARFARAGDVLNGGGPSEIRLRRFPAVTRLVPLARERCLDSREVVETLVQRRHSVVVQSLQPSLVLFRRFPVLRLRLRLAQTKNRRRRVVVPRGFGRRLLPRL